QPHTPTVPVADRTVPVADTPAGTTASQPAAATPDTATTRSPPSTDSDTRQPSSVRAHSPTTAARLLASPTPGQRPVVPGHDAGISPSVPELPQHLPPPPSPLPATPSQPTAASTSPDEFPQPLHLDAPPRPSDSLSSPTGDNTYHRTLTLRVTRAADRQL